MKKSINTVKILCVTLALLVAITSVVIVWNTMRLSQEMDERTQQYVADLSHQISKAIDERLSRNIADLEVISDGLLQVYSYNRSHIAEFLEGTCKTSAFNSLIAAGLDGRVYQTDSSLEQVTALPGVQAALAGSNAFSYLEDQSILYSIPIRLQGKVVGMLGGIRDKQSMQRQLQTEGLSSRSLSCIIDQDGSVILSPTELAPFMQLDSLFREDPDGSLAGHIRQLEADIKNRRDGAFEFVAPDGSDVVLSYHALSMYDWVLLTLVPSDILSVGINDLMGRTILIVAVLIVLMGIAAAILFILQRSHYKSAMVDRVTGGMNASAFQLKCEAALSHAAPGTRSIMLMNIKNFKLINGEFGSQRGDKTLRHLMQVIDRRVRKRGFAARADADNFFLFLEAGDPAKIQEIHREIMADIAHDVSLFNEKRAVPYEFVVQAGAYIIEDPSLDIMVIQDRAKIACKSRTSLEDGVCKFYDAAVIERIRKEHELNGLFDSAFASGGFHVYFQPKVWTRDGRVAGAEALVRWQHPLKGIISPGDFLPLFEDNGKICELDLYVFEEVCKAMRRWADSGRALLPVSVNLSRRHFRQSDWLRPFVEIARRYQIPDGLLELELTESVFFTDRDITDMQANVEAAHKAGFLCSLDDFGSGFSSLELLIAFEIDTLKLDRSFFLNVSNARTKEVVASIVELAHKIGAHIVAEGIETPEQLSLLKEVHCDMVQGYIYAKPLPIPEFEQWLKNREG